MAHYSSYEPIEALYQNKRSIIFEAVEQIFWQANDLSQLKVAMQRDPEIVKQWSEQDDSNSLWNLFEDIKKYADEILALRPSK